MANAPQKVTRKAPFNTGAPPAAAPTAPRTARKISDPILTKGVMRDRGASEAINKGAAAPAVKVAAEVKAA